MEHDQDTNTLRTLTDSQRIAIRILVGGGTDREAAEAAGKTRETVNRWSHHHPEFQAELNRQRQQLQDEHADKCRVMNGLAIDFILQGMRDGDPEAFKTWLKLSGVGRVDTAVTGPQHSDDIILEHASLWRKRMKDDDCLFDSEGNPIPGTRRSGSSGEIFNEVEREILELASADSGSENCLSIKTGLTTDCSGEAESNPT